MAGYSTTPLARKLGVREDQTVAILGAPEGWAIEGLPGGVRVRRRLGPDAALILAFFPQRAKLRRRLPALVARVPPDGCLWVAWPRRAAGHHSDISENDLRELILPTGLVDVKVAALDEDWSGLKFVWRRKLRSRPPNGYPHRGSPPDHGPSV